ncbi:DinB family protein [Pedobacter psychrotolerans]|uniref:DinB family protein n=1 Tax=Pedobacter psychrotolerans TaxID=1843235 RepID=A0A4R2HLR4_9SPHI|nr:DinB family protein [Pedobacter psychrotolerans]TCO31008.1 DinB family protein [Pedobacter psychrotolerans]GGE42856.1 hypothetical protein GCM10011413_06030 [Pedobacter psychrotolerans]
MPSSEEQINQIKNTRIYILDLVKDLSIEQLNKIPAGFNNNIIWNIAHLTAAQQNLCYSRSHLLPTVEDKHLFPFLSGTKPDSLLSEIEIKDIYNTFLASIDQFKIDYANNLFLKFDQWDKRYGIKLKNIEDAINFVPFHEGMHIGYIMALKKLV